MHILPDLHKLEQQHSVKGNVRLWYSTNVSYAYPTPFHLPSLSISVHVSKDCLIRNLRRALMWVCLHACASTPLCMCDLCIFWNGREDYASIHSLSLSLQKPQLTATLHWCKVASCLSAMAYCYILNMSLLCSNCPIITNPPKIQETITTAYLAWGRCIRNQCIMDIVYWTHLHECHCCTSEYFNALLYINASVKLQILCWLYPCNVKSVSCYQTLHLHWCGPGSQATFLSLLAFRLCVLQEGRGKRLCEDLHQVSQTHSYHGPREHNAFSHRAS